MVIVFSYYLVQVLRDELVTPVVVVDTRDIPEEYVPQSVHDTVSESGKREGM